MPVFGHFAACIKTRLCAFTLLCHLVNLTPAVQRIFYFLPAYCSTNLLAMLEAELPASCDMASPTKQQLRWYLGPFSFPRHSKFKVATNGKHPNQFPFNGVQRTSQNLVLAMYGFIHVSKSNPQMNNFEEVICQIQ